MADQPLVPQEVQDMIDGKVEQLQPPVTGNKRIFEKLEKQEGDANA